MFNEYVFGHLHATDERDVTIIDWVKLMCEQTKIPDGVRIKNLHKILEEEDPNHDATKLAVINFEMQLLLM